jgi:hypothetical protein
LKKTKTLQEITNLTFIWTRTDVKQTSAKVMKITQTAAPYPKYDDNMLEGTKSTETKQILKDNAKQTCYGKTKPDSGT